MRIRSLIVFGAGIVLGYRLAARLRQDDPAVAHGPREVSRSPGLSSVPGMRAVASGAQRLADQASVRSLDAIRRARGAIRERLAEDDDLAAWQ
jgi:hypothetical protein